GLEVAFGIGLQPFTRSVERGALADAGQYVVQRALRRGCVKDIIGGDQGNASGLGGGGKFGKLAGVPP
ncbi:hypothetical protein ACTGUQ_12560, partial [Streptococcus suis]